MMQSISQTWRRAAAWLACAALLPFAVNAQNAQSAQNTSKKLEPITYLLPTSPNLPAFAPWMIARQLGYYEDGNRSKYEYFQDFTTK